MQKIYCVALLTGLMTLGLSTACSASEIYKVVDEQGRVVFTNKPTKNGQRVQLGKVQFHKPRATTATTHTHQANISLGSYPKVSQSQQNKRDSRRRQILSQELINETRLLDKAMKAIHSIEQKSKQDSSKQSYFVASQFDILQLRDRAASHERNIKALETELNNI